MPPLKSQLGDLFILYSGCHYRVRYYPGILHIQKRKFEKEQERIRVNQLHEMDDEITLLHQCQP